MLTNDTAVAECKILLLHNEQRCGFFLKLTLWVNGMPDVMYYYWQFFWGNGYFGFLKYFHYSHIFPAIDFILCCDKDNRELWPL